MNKNDDDNHDDGKVRVSFMLAATFDLAAFPSSYDRPSKENCQSFENHGEHAQNMNNTRKRPKDPHHFCLGFSFDSIIPSKVLLSNIALRRSGPGERRVNCVRLATSFRLIFCY